VVDDASSDSGLYGVGAELKTCKGLMRFCANSGAWPRKPPQQLHVQRTRPVRPYRYHYRYQNLKTADAIARNDKGLSKKAFVFNDLH
jgi:hypothetical protein